MARKRVVSRTVKGTIVNVLAVDIETQEVKEIEIPVGVKYTSTEKALKAISKIMPENQKAVAVLTLTEFEQKYAMDEEQFIKMATPIE